MLSSGDLYQNVISSLKSNFKIMSSRLIVGIILLPMKTPRNKWMTSTLRSIKVCQRT